MPAVGRLASVVIDVANLDRAVAFWSSVLGAEPGERFLHYQFIGPRHGTPAIVLQEVPEPKVGKNRMHLDLACEDINAALRQVEQLGGRKVREIQDPGETFIVVADVDGNEFCLLPKKQS